MNLNLKNLIQSTFLKKKTVSKMKSKLVTVKGTIENFLEITPSKRFSQL